jgi:HPt (histidine-containing phosphotransfer) domain-containing protein
MFAEKEADAATRIAAALDVQDHATAQRIAHAIHGAAGNVGLTELETSAAALEHAIKAGEGIQEAFPRFEQSLSRAIAALNRALLAAAKPAAITPDEAPKQLKHLAAMLAASDGEAVNYFLDHAPAIRSMFPDEDQTDFEKSITSFDFVAALRWLQPAARAHGISLQEKPA